MGRPVASRAFKTSCPVEMAHHLNTIKSGIFCSLEFFHYCLPEPNASPHYPFLQVSGRSDNKDLKFRARLLLITLLDAIIVFFANCLRFILYYGLIVGLSAMNSNSSEKSIALVQHLLQELFQGFRAQDQIHMF